MPKSKAVNIFLLIIMDTSTRFPEAIPLWTISVTNVVNAMLQFFTMFGLPQEVQSDQGSNFMLRVFQQALHKLGIKQIRFSAYHSENQRALERYHQILKSMIRKYCYDFKADWDKEFTFYYLPQEKLLINHWFFT